ncbi:MAG: T9SS-dependent M36 family metallopeptidase [Candidatus Promineifilaceae bacterium]
MPPIQLPKTRHPPHIGQRSVVAPGHIGYLTGPNTGAPLDIALNFLRQNRDVLGLTAADLADYVVTDQYTSNHNGVTHIYLRQRYNGIEVYGANININITSDGRVLNMGNSFIANLGVGAKNLAPTLSAVEAVTAAANHLGLPLTTPVTQMAAPAGVESAQILSNGGISQNAIPAKLVYEFYNNQVHIAWDLVIYELSAEHWWNLRIDAQSGDMLSQVDWVINEHLGHTEHNDSDVVDLDQTTAAAASAEPSLVPESYRVFPLPVESPSHGSNALVLNPFDPTASPFGWHDTNGVTGAEHTITRGNNVYADTDLDASNTPDGSSPDGGSGLVFDYVFDDTQNPGSYIPFAVTNLFYWNNIMHDVSYHYGFDEAAGNFQSMNYSGQGAGNDYVNADAQDGSGNNNANFATPPDGSNPRMQMYVWTPPLTQIVTVNTPPVIAGDYSASGANFGPTLSSTGPITGNLSLVNDSTGPDVNDGCQTYVSFPAGAIALVHRGNCTFVVKVANAQAAGAIAVIVTNNIATPPGTMGGTDPSITIPSVMISLADGQAFEANLPINATLKDGSGQIPNRDSDLDSGIITHEYGHGISNRLTGGPATTGCLSNQEQMGEGWSDWQTMFYTALPSQTRTTARGVGTYAVFQPTTGIGIRPAPYTTDTVVNAYTYANIDDGGVVTIPHGLGFVWNTMLWEVYWNLVDQYGFNPNLYEDWTTGGNNLAYQLIMDGLKLQPCSPGFVDGRDAILAADLALTGGINQCAIWDGFAARGLGYSASQGSSATVGDETEAFDLPPVCTAVTVVSPQPAQTVCVGDAADFNILIGGGFTAPVDMSTTGEPAGSVATFSPDPVTSTPGTSVLTVSTTSGTTPSGNHVITVAGTDASTSASTPVTLTVVSGSAATPTLTTPADGATNQSIRPLLIWSATGDSYNVEVASDATFTTIVDSATGVVGNSYRVSVDLTPGATYYWRIAATNVCGTGATSAAFSFAINNADGSCSDPTLTPQTVYSEDFTAGDGSWTHNGGTTGVDTWTLSSANPSPQSGGNAWYAQDFATPSDQRLVSAPITLPTVTTTTLELSLQFWNYQNFEDPAGSGGCWDGGHLEISTDGSTWTTLDAELLNDLYDGTMNNGPLFGEGLWCGSPEAWHRTVVALDAYGGQTVQFRFTAASDAAAGAEGWYIDDVTVQSCEFTPTDVTLSGLSGDHSSALPLIGLVVALTTVLLSVPVVLRLRRRLS